MNIRVPGDLRAAARRRGVSQSILVRSALEHAASSPPDPMPVAAPVSEQGGGDTQFVCWLAAHARVPRSLMRMGIARGWVRVDGVECRDVTGGAWEVAEVTFDGRAV